MGWMDDDGMLRHGKTSQGKFAGVRARAMGGHRAKKDEESAGSDDAKRTPILCPPYLQFSVGRRQNIWHITSRSSGRTGEATSRMLLAPPLAQNWRASEHRTPGGASPPSPESKNGPKIVSLMISHAKPSPRRKYNAYPTSSQRERMAHPAFPNSKSVLFVCKSAMEERGKPHKSRARWDAWVPDLPSIQHHHIAMRMLTLLSLHSDPLPEHSHRWMG